MSDAANDALLKDLEVQRVLVVSTGHLTTQTRECLANGIENVVLREYKYGWMVYSGEGMYLPTLPDGFPDLRDAIQLAKRLGCQWVNFDADADRVDHLSWYEDGEPANDANDAEPQPTTTPQPTTPQPIMVVGTYEDGIVLIDVLEDESAVQQFLAMSVVELVDPYELGVILDAPTTRAAASEVMCLTNWDIEYYPFRGPTKTADIKARLVELRAEHSHFYGEANDADE